MKPVRMKHNPEFWNLRLYVAGQTPKSMRALANLEVICEERLKGRYRIEVIDLLKDPQRARREQIVAIPTLVREHPLPIQKLIGDLSNNLHILVAVDPRQATDAT